MAEEQVEVGRNAEISFIVKLRDAFELAFQACQELLEVMAPKDWKTIEAKKPLNPQNPAIKWLEKRLAEVKAKYPVTFEFLKDDKGFIVGLRYSASDEEVAADIESPAIWAFTKASQQPQKHEKPSPT